MPTFNYIEDRFNNLSLKVKIELFLLPLSIFVLTFFLILEKSSIIKKPYINNNSIININKIQMNEKIPNILKNIEKYSKSNFITIKSISSDINSIEIEIIKDKQGQVKFLKYLEDYNSFSKINSIYINKNIMNIKLVFEKVFIKDSLDISSRIKSLEKHDDIKLKLLAIIGKKAYVNNKWLKVGDKYEYYKLIDINKNSVSLEHNNKKIKLKVYDNELN